MRYLLVGGASALTELALFAALVKILPEGLTAANVIAVCTATLLNFALNRFWSFRSTSALGRSFVLYLALFVFNLSFGTYAIHYLVGLGLYEVYAKLITMVMITGWNFVIYRWVVFRG